MEAHFPAKLRRGDLVRLVAPARSRAIVTEHDHTAIIDARFAALGLTLSFGEHVDECDEFDSSSAAALDTLFAAAPIELRQASTWTDDLWFLDQDQRQLLDNDGWWAMQPGTGAGRIIGGNLCTLNLLQGSGHMPSLDGALLMLEDDEETNAVHFARDLTSLLQLPDAGGIQGLVVGRFQRSSRITRGLLEQIIANQPRLAGLPVLANADFGHTSPMATLPIGGQATVTVATKSTLTITSH